MTTFSVAANQEKKRASSSLPRPVDGRSPLHVWRAVPWRRPRPREAFGVCRDEGRIDGRPAGQVDEQAVEQDGIAAATQRQLQVRRLRGRGAPRIDVDDAGAAPLLFAIIRWNSTGWHQAAFEPTRTIRSASSRSS